MIVPDFWAEARVQQRHNGRQFTVRRFGWSDSSLADAERMANERALEALESIVRGSKQPRREPKVPYNGAEGVPIREEVLSRHGEEVVTRNSYGAECLNSPSAFFVDVDHDSPLTFAMLVLAYGLLFVPAILTAAHWRSLTLGLFLSLGGLFLAAPVARACRRLLTALTGGPLNQLLRRIERFAAAQPTPWSVRVYKSPGGFRLLVTHRPFDTGDPVVQAFFKAVRADPLYARMCARQRCFRARLTPKPWRIGMTARLRPRPGVWPVKPDAIQSRIEWVISYNTAAAPYASCTFLCGIGPSYVHQRIQPVLDLHDLRTSAHRHGAPIA